MNQLAADSSLNRYQLLDLDILANSRPFSVSWTHDFVARQAALQPAALAVCDEKYKLTFLELDQQANRLARHIQSLGVGPEVLVALYFERSVDFVVAALAVLKAGGAYVPLDSVFPATRIETILKDANVAVLLSHRCMAANLSTGSWRTVDLDRDASDILIQSPEGVAAQIAGDQLAYVIYTSGSMGHPKGVEVTHANLLHLVEWYQRTRKISVDDRASQILGLAFDAAVLEVWGHLTAGASLHLIDEYSRRSPEGLRDWLLTKEITIGFAPAVTAEQLITFHWPAQTALRILVAGGDILHRHPRADLPFVLENQYGPTECTVVATSGRVPSSETNGQLPSIGRPIDDTEILIMDTDMKRLPPSEVGEICISGPQVARGYRNLPELTAEKFVFEADTAKRLYRTGDRGRVLPDGQVDFLGRMDDQIKIRGFRVEPAEVVLHLNSHPQVSSSFVISRRDDDASEKTLVAYVLPASAGGLTAGELRKFLQSRIPDYMIPSVFVNMQSLYLTPNGKWDKQALPPPTAANLLPESIDTKSSSNGRQTGTEVAIGQVVRGLLDGRPIGREDNFFLVGGCSLMAGQLLVRLRQALPVNLSLRQLFEAPTIASLAEVVDRKLATT